MKGSRLCGQVSFVANGQPEGFSVCHCPQCRKQSGHLCSSAYVPDGDLSVTGEVRWYQSSGKARRCFCPIFGSVLFWKHEDDPHISFALGAVDGPIGARLEKHIFTASKGDYYDIADGVQQL